jgi:hypothetical protein
MENNQHSEQSNISFGSKIIDSLSGLNPDLRVVQVTDQRVHFGGDGVPGRNRQVEKVPLR